MRFVVGVQITVAGPSTPQVQIGTIGIGALPGTKVPSVTVHLSNTGRGLCKPTLRVTISNLAGRTRTVVSRLDTVLPGTSIDFPLPWPRPLSAGRYEVLAQAADCGPPAATHATATLASTLSGTPTAPNALPAVATARRTGVPLWAVGPLCTISALLFGALTAALIAARREPHDAS